MKSSHGNIQSWVRPLFSECLGEEGSSWNVTKCDKWGMGEGKSKIAIFRVIDFCMAPFSVLLLASPHTANEDQLSVNNYLTKSWLIYYLEKIKGVNHLLKNMEIPEISYAFGRNPFRATNILFNILYYIWNFQASSIICLIFGTRICLLFFHRRSHASDVIGFNLLLFCLCWRSHPPGVVRGS